MSSNQTPKVAFKDQMREVIPVAEAFAVGESQLADEALALQQQLEDERQARQQAQDVQQRQLEEERRARQQAEQARLEAERRLAALQQDNSSPAANNPGITPVATEHESESRKSYAKHFLAGAALLLVVLAAVGGICGSGNCSGSSVGATNFSPSSDATRAPVQTETAPTQSPVSPRPTQSPVTRPTSRPIVPPSPRPVAPPEPQPTTTTSRSESMVLYINSITLSGRTLSYPNGNAFPEEEALNWLIEDDVGTSETDERKLRQRFALATFWFANGPFDSDLLDTWLTSIDECDWVSIDSCVGGEVTRIWLFRDGLNGQLPSDLALLTAMTTLHLHVNQLTGSIPTEFGLLTALTWLSLNRNQLTGTIPTELTQMTALTRFWIYNNNVSGDMPFCDGATRPTRFTNLEADCNEVSCPCCTECCPNGGFEGIPSGSNSCDA